jgi:hypothetical protein
MKPLPYRHLYHAEIDGEGLGIMHRVMRMFRKIRPQAVKRNWHYSDMDTGGGFAMFLCRDAEGKQYEVYGDWEPERPPLKIRHL